jgi:hypothetical protein
MLALGAAVAYGFTRQSERRSMEWRIVCQHDGGVKLKVQAMVEDVNQEMINATENVLKEKYLYATKHAATT